MKIDVAIIGAGPAGVVAAKTLLLRGHDVTLYEKEKVVFLSTLPVYISIMKCVCWTCDYFVNKLWTKKYSTIIQNCV